MKLTFAPHTLYYNHPFKIAHGTRSSTDIVLTRVEYNGLIGYGEASLPPYLVETTETVIAFLNKAKHVLSSFVNPLQLEFILQEIDTIENGNTAAKAAIDIALHDLVGKLQNKPTWELFGCDKNNTPFTTYTIGIGTPDSIREKILEATSYKYLKIKLNGVDDQLIIETIRSTTDKPIVIDVNQGWKDKFQALEMIHWLENKNVLFIEQPLPKENWDDAYWLFERSKLPLFADESVQRYSDIDKVKDCFNGINIKLMKCTGLYEANKMIRYARQLKLKILVGCMSETSCAISAAAQLTPLVDYADLDGCLLINNDLFNGIKFDEGKIMLNEKPGIGVVPEE